MTLRERLTELGWQVAERPYLDGLYYARDPDGRRCSVNLEGGTWCVWGEPPVWRKFALDAVPVDPRLQALAELREQVRGRWPHVVVDFEGELSKDCFGLVCTNRRNGTQFLARQVDDVVRVCGDPPPAKQRSLFG